MAAYGVSLTVTYTAWDKSADAGKTGDAANHTLSLVRDGTAVSPTNTPQEVAGGEYKLTLTAAEMQARSLTLRGTSSTSGVVIVPVRLTTLTLTEIAAAVWDALTSGMATVGSIGKRIVDYLTGDAFNRIGANGAGLTSLGDARLGNLDAAVSSRLATSGYTAPPSAAANATAVRTELTTELGRIDAAISTRSTYAGADTAGTTTLLSRLTSGRATNLDNLDAAVSSRMATFTYTAPLDAAGVRTAVGLASANLDTQLAAIPTTAAPTAAVVAAQVRTELTTELGRLDVAVSTRLATASYTAAPTASQVSTQVRVDLITDHGSGAWTTATGFSTPANVTAARDAVILALPAAAPTLEQIAGRLLLAPANKLKTNADGSVDADLAIDTAALAEEIADQIEVTGLTAEEHAKVMRIGSPNALVLAPVYPDADGNLVSTIVLGFDYTAASGRPFSVTDADASFLPAAGTAVGLYLGPKYGTAPGLTVTSTVTEPGDGSRVAAFDLPRATLAALAPGEYTAHVYERFVGDVDGLDVAIPTTIEKGRPTT